MLPGDNVAPPRVAMHVRTGQYGHKQRIHQLRRVHPIGSEHLYHPATDWKVRVQVRFNSPLQARLHASLHKGDRTIRDAERDAVGLSAHVTVQRTGAEPTTIEFTSRLSPLPTRPEADRARTSRDEMSRAGPGNHFGPSAARRADTLPTADATTSSSLG